MPKNSASVKQAESALYTEGWIDEDLACMTHDVAASAIVDGSGNTRVLVWDIDVDAGSIEHANPIVVNHATADGFVPKSGHSGDSSTTITSKKTDTGRDPIANGYKGYGESKPVDLPEQDEATPFTEPIASTARIDTLGLGNLAVIEETNQGIYLSLYGVSDQHSTFLHDWEFLGEGTEARVTRVEAATGTYIVTAHELPTGLAELNTFKVFQSDDTPGAFLLSNALDTKIVVAGPEFEITHFGGAFFVEGLRVQAWRSAPRN